MRCWHSLTSLLANDHNVVQLYLYNIRTLSEEIYFVRRRAAERSATARQWRRPEASMSSGFIDDNKVL